MLMNNSLYKKNTVNKYQALKSRMFALIHVSLLILNNFLVTFLRTVSKTYTTKSLV